MVVAPPPGQTITLLDEFVLLVYDPLTGTQTMLVQPTFAGTTAPFGLLIPVPRPARVATQSERLRNAVRARLHPRGRLQRTLNVEFTSLAASCAVRAVGDGVPGPDDQKKTVPAAQGQVTNLGISPEPTQDWLLANGFTVAPAQAAWLSDLRDRGWSIIGVVVRPPAFASAPPARMRGPVLTLTHEASEPAYAAGHPPFALRPGDEAAPPLELAVLTEWAVAVDTADPPEPFFADTLDEAAITRLNNDAGGLPWVFRREGTLTGYAMPRPPDAGIVRFVRTDARPQLRPEAAPRLRAQHLRVPVELLVGFLFLLGWGWVRVGGRVRANFRGRRQQRLG
ncbi:MAG: DUF2330 domain-containing protein, partial [Myxococcales bacterium]|nr:DUF2330 domain-containing protein [Myxococcales bacterium]